MNVLEKILEEIKDNKLKFKDQNDIAIGVGLVEDIIHSHMEKRKKVSSAEIVERDIDGKPYYGIKYKEIGKDEFNIGYGSYYLDYVVKWLNDCFEVVEIED